MPITFDSVPASAAASAVFVEQKNVNRGTGSPVITRRVLVIGQYNNGKSPTANVPQLILSKEDAWDRYGRGSMIAAMIVLQLENSEGVQVYGLPVANHASGVAATGTIEITGAATAAGTLALYIGGKKIAVAVANEAAAAEIAAAINVAVNADLDLPVTSSVSTSTVTLTSRHPGEVGNQIVVELNRADTDETPAGITPAITAMGSAVAGANDPSLDTALGNLGDTWFTDIIMPYLSADALSSLESAGDARVAPGVKRPFAAFVGYTGTSAALVTALESRNKEWTTIVPVHDSPTPAYMIAAAAGTLFAAKQQTNPGRPLKGLILPGVIAGSTNDLTWATRNTIVAAGGSHTYNMEDDTVTVGDLVTTRTTEDSGADTDDWRFTVIIANLQFKLYALEQTFMAEPFNRGVVMADGAGRGPTYAIRPSTVISYARSLVVNWGERGLSTAIETILKNITAEINSSNPGRIDLSIPDTVAAGSRIIAALLNWAYITG